MIDDFVKCFPGVTRAQAVTVLAHAERRREADCT
jgi:hypothetical protein